MGADSACCDDGTHVCFSDGAEANLSEPQGKSMSLDCVMGDMFGDAQQILMERAYRVLDSVQDLVHLEAAFRRYTASKSFELKNKSVEASGRQCRAAH